MNKYIRTKDGIYKLIKIRKNEYRMLNADGTVHLAHYEPEDYKIADTIEDLLEKYNIPDLEYLEKCIIDHDKYNELNEQLRCPVEVLVKVVFNNETILVLNPVDKSIQEIISPMRFYKMDRHAFDIRCENFTDTYRTNKWTSGGAIFYLSDYKRTWWLKSNEVSKNE